MIWVCECGVIWIWCVLNFVCGIGWFGKLEKHKYTKLCKLVGWETMSLGEVKVLGIVQVWVKKSHIGYNRQS